MAMVRDEDIQELVREAAASLRGLNFSLAAQVRDDQELYTKWGKGKAPVSELQSLTTWDRTQSPIYQWKFAMYMYCPGCASHNYNTHKVTRYGDTVVETIDTECHTCKTSTHIVLTQKNKPTGGEV